MPTNLYSSKGSRFLFWWLHLIVKESLHTMSHLVPTIQTSYWNSYEPSSFLALIEKGSSSWKMSHFIDLMKYNKLLKTWDTSTSVCHHLNVGEWVSWHIKSHVRRNDLHNHRTLLLHINDDVQVIIADMVQDWIREVNRYFGRASHGGAIRRIIYTMYRPLWN